MTAVPMDEPNSVSPLLIDKHDGVAVLTMNRPQSRNAMNVELANALAAAIDDVDADSAISVVVLTGAGGTFCAGMDLKAFANGEVPTIEGRGFGGMTQRPPTKPTIAAVEGWALAGGFELVLSCDLVVASRDAKFGIPEVKRGLFAAAGGLLRLPKAMPYQLAMELALTGDPITATQAQQYGLVNRVTEPGSALASALELAKTIAANGPLALQATKAIMSMAAHWTDNEELAAQRVHYDVVFSSADALEGARSFAEKRAPVWRGV
jgi:enoyl-CoA hydratase